MAKFSADFTNQLRNFGRRDPNAPAEPLLGTNDPLAKSLGGLFGMDMRTGRERAQADRAKLDPKLAPLDKLMAEYQIQSQYAETDSARNAALAGLAQTQAAIAARDKRLADEEKKRAGMQALVTGLRDENMPEVADLVESGGYTASQGQQRLMEQRKMTKVAEKGQEGRLALLTSKALGDSAIFQRTVNGDFDNVPPASYAKLVTTAQNQKEMLEVLASEAEVYGPYKGDIEAGVIRNREELLARMKEDRAKVAGGEAKPTRVTNPGVVDVPGIGQVRSGMKQIDGKDTPVYWDEDKADWLPQPKGTTKTSDKIPSVAAQGAAEIAITAFGGDLMSKLSKAQRSQAQLRIADLTQKYQNTTDMTYDAAARKAVAEVSESVSIDPSSGFLGFNKKATLKPASSGGPQVGDIQGGYRFLGGDQYDQNNWELVE